MLAVTQLDLFASPTDTIQTKRRPGRPKGSRSTYTQHRQPQVAELRRVYAIYTLKELEQLWGIPWPKIQGLARRHKIRKRAANKQPHPKAKAKTHIPTAAAVA